MKENFIKNEFSFSSVKESYESPRCEILSVESEGVLCGSCDGAGINDFTIDEGNSFGTDIWK